MSQNITKNCKIVKDVFEAYLHIEEVTGFQPTSIIHNGSIHRFGKKKSKAYAAHLKESGDILINFGSWDSGTGEDLQHTVVVKSFGDLSLAEQEQNKKLIEAKEKQREKEKEQKRQKGLAELARIFKDGSRNIPETEYLKNKMIPAETLVDANLIHYKNFIGIPYFDIGDNQQQAPLTYERIYDNGKGKFTIKGLSKAGLSHMLTFNANPDSKTLGFCESYFTAFIIHRATHIPIVATGGTSNVLPVINKFLNDSYYSSKYKFVYFADNDLKREAETGINPGQKKADEVLNLGIPVCSCPENSDFCDIYTRFRKEGLSDPDAIKEVAKIIEKSLIQPDDVEEDQEEEREAPEQRIERLKNLYPFTTPPLEALPTLNNGIKIGDIIQNLADSIGCSTNSMIGSALLVPLNIAGQFVLCKKHDSHNLKNRFNIVDISLPSTGKTAAQEQLAFNPLDDYYMDEIEEYKFLLAEYEKAEKLAEAKQKKGDILTSDEENFLKKEKPLNPGKPSVTGGTIQGYARPGTAPVNKTKLLFMDEIQELAKQVLNPKADIDAGGLVKLMDGSRYRPNHATKDEGGSNIQIHLLGNTQPDNFQKYMKPLLENNDGFAVRILYTYDGTGKPFEPKTEEDFYKTWLPKYKEAWLSLVQRGCDFNKNICNIYKEKLKNEECQKINPPVLCIGLNEDTRAEYLRIYNETGSNIQQGEGDLLS
ncbi:MAG: hypothetical protein AB7E04_12525, partial [Desulfobacteraceae bacterium]